MACQGIAALFIAAILAMGLYIVLSARALRGRLPEGVKTSLFFPLYLFNGRLFDGESQTLRYAALAILALAAIFLILLGVPLTKAYLGGATEICGLAF
jgi:hypothetical protein